MKKALIVISNMELGGAQRSLLSFLQCICGSDWEKQYEIDLMVIDPVGAFLSQVPPQVHIVEPPKQLRWLGTAFGKELLTRHFSFRCLLRQCTWIAKKKLHRFPKKWNVQQRLWSVWKSLIPAWPTHYDVAVSYIDGSPNYYVMEKVSADKKALWVHNEYQKLGYDPEFDRKYYESAQSIITISPKCRQCILEEYPHLSQRVYVLENITVTKEVLEKSRAGQCPEFTNASGLKLLSVGRLNSQKGFDMAIESAKILKEQGIEFLWLVLGEGPDRQMLEQMIQDLNVGDCFRLLGSRDNPYAYMAKCDYLVQSSRFEGKSLVLDEAKILNTPVIVTDYTTARDSVEHGKTGWIVSMSPQGIAQGIAELGENPQCKETIVSYLKNLPKGNEEELRKYTQYML